VKEKVAIYVRVSTEDQADKQTIQTQLFGCREYTNQQGWEVVDEFLDEGVSGSVLLEERPAGAQLLKRAEEGAFVRVVVYRYDRLSRDTLGCLLALKRLESLSAPVCSVDEHFENTPSGHFARTVITAVAELEKNMIRQRTMDGRARKVREGKYMASITPFGYVRENGQILPHPKNADVVRQIFQWSREGLGLKAIAARLEKNGIPPPSPAHPRRQSRWGWHFSTVHKILSAPRYTGQSKYGNTPMSCPALIDPETFQAAQEGLKNRKLNSPRNTKHAYLLQHLVYCRHCGSRYSSRTVNRTGGTSTVYVCYQRRAYGHKAGHENVQWHWPAEQLEAPVKRWIIELFTHPEYIDNEIQLHIERAKHESRDLIELQDRSRKRLIELEQEELRVIEFGRKLYIDESQMIKQLNEIQAERREVKGSLENPYKVPTDINKLELLEDVVRSELFVGLGLRIGVNPDVDDARIDRTLDRMGRLPTVLKIPIDLDGDDGAFQNVELNLEEGWRNAIQALVEKIWVEDDRSITVEGVLPIDPELVSDFNRSQ